jgi:hypothetical protein
MMGVIDATIRNGARCPIPGPAARDIGAIFFSFPGCQNSTTELVSY